MALTGEAKRLYNKAYRESRKAEIKAYRESRKAEIKASNKAYHAKNIRSISGFIKQQFSTIKKTKSGDHERCRKRYYNIKFDLTLQDIADFVTSNERLIINMWRHHDKQDAGKTFHTLPEVGMRDISLGWVRGNLVAETAKASLDKIEAYNKQNKNLDPTDPLDLEIETFEKQMRRRIKQPIKFAKSTTQDKMRNFIESVNVADIDVDKIHEYQV